MYSFCTNTEHLFIYVDSPFKIKNSNFKVKFKNMIKVVRDRIGLLKASIMRWMKAEVLRSEHTSIIGDHKVHKDFLWFNLIAIVYNTDHRQIFKLNSRYYECRSLNFFKSHHSQRRSLSFYPTMH